MYIYMYICMCTLAMCICVLCECRYEVHGALRWLAAGTVVKLVVYKPTVLFDFKVTILDINRF